MKYFYKVRKNESNCSCFCHIINIYLSELSQFVWEICIQDLYPICTACSVNKSEIQNILKFISKENETIKKIMKCIAVKNPA